jgi:LuxR family transcriptional regulator, maltose regulon positive regulatory protein
MNEQIPSEPLSEREHEILRLFSEQLRHLEIAKRLLLSLHTVKWYTCQIYRKLGAKNRREAIERARELGLLAPNDADE